MSGARLIAEGLTEAECRHLSGLSTQDAIAWCERRNAHAALAEGARAKFGHAFDVTSSADAVTFTSKPRPQPGDVVPWTEVEDGALYYVAATDRFRMALRGVTGSMGGPADPDIAAMLNGRYAGSTAADLGDGYPHGTLVARDLGSDPEAWRKAMREWTANGNRPSKPDLSSMTAAQAADLSPLAPLRANLQERIGLDLSGCAPERVVALALERIEADRREIEMTLSVHSRSCARSKSRVADLERVKSQLEGSMRETRALCERNVVMAQEHARSVDALTAQRDEARRALADEKVAHAAMTRSYQNEAERRRAVEAGAGQATMLLNAWQRWARPLWPEGPPNPADAALRSAIEGRVTRGIPLPNEEALSALRKTLPANLHDDPSDGRTPSDMVHGAARRLLHLEQRGRFMIVALQAATDRAEKAERNLRAAAELLAA